MTNKENLILEANWVFKVFREGKEIWTESGKNLIVDTGLDLLMNSGLTGQTLFVGLTGNSPTAAAADTMASHAGWTEVTNYEETERQAYTQGALTNQSVTNAASPATFTISTGGANIGGAFLTTDLTKGGTAGTLFSVKALAEGNRTLLATDVLEITASISIASS